MSIILLLLNFSSTQMLSILIVRVINFFICLASAHQCVHTLYHKDNSVFNAIPRIYRSKM